MKTGSGYATKKWPKTSFSSTGCACACFQCELNARLSITPRTVPPDGKLRVTTSPGCADDVSATESPSVSRPDTRWRQRCTTRPREGGNSPHPLDLVCVPSKPPLCTNTVVPNVTPCNSPRALSEWAPPRTPHHSRRHSNPSTGGPGWVTEVFFFGGGGDFAQPSQGSWLQSRTPDVRVVRPRRSVHFVRVLLVSTACIV